MERNYVVCEMVELNGAGLQKYGNKKIFTCDIYNCPYNNGEKLRIGLNPINVCSTKGKIPEDEKGKISLERKAASS